MKGVNSYKNNMKIVMNKIYLHLIFLAIFFSGFIVDVFFIKPENTYTDWVSDIRLFSLLFLWLIIWKISRFTSIATFKITLILIVILSFLFIFFPGNPSSERLASWIYVFLATGVIQQLFEVRKKRS